MIITELFSTPVYEGMAPTNRIAVHGAEVDNALLKSEMLATAFTDGGDHFISDPTFSRNILKDCDMKSLETFIGVHVDKYVDSLNDFMLDPKISTAWLTLTEPGKHTQAHNHNPHQISGVYYHKVPEGSGDLVLHEPNGLIGTSRFIARPNRMYVQPQAGKIVLFPSWLSHHVETNCSNASRISLAFNVDFA